MTGSPLRGLKRFLRRPAVIVGEVAAIALAATLGAALPQVDTASPEAYARFWGSGFFGGVGTATGMNHVFRSIWFLAILLLSVASLLVVLLEQIRGLRARAKRPPSVESFRNAPFQVAFERPAALAADGAKVDIRVRGWFGRFGSPLFHSGLLLVVTAGILRALFGVTAGVDLLEGERLAPQGAAWPAQWPGPLAPPFRLPVPLVLESVNPEPYPNGQIKALDARLRLEQPSGPREAGIGINRELTFEGRRLFVDTTFGPAALLEWQTSGGGADREAVLLIRMADGSYAGTAQGPGGLHLALRSGLGPAGRHPSRMEIRVLRGGALLFAGSMRVGERMALPGSGASLGLEGLPFWIRLHGSRDPALGLALAGFVLVLAGATLLFGVVPIDTCVVVAPLGETEWVFVAVRPLRFAPLYRGLFDRLVQDQGGPE